MNMKTDSRQQLIPPTQIRVKAGFVVYAPDSEQRCIVILDDGELEAREKDSPHKTVFTMHPGDLVGVASLLEREPFKYQLVASRDSNVTLITEECMESELTRLPLWLLAVIRSLGSKTRDFKQAGLASNVQDSLRSLAEFLSHKESRKDIPLQDLLLEYSLISRLKGTEIIQSFKGLARRHFIEITHSKNEDGSTTDCCRIPDVRLLETFVGYLSARSKEQTFPPYTLSRTQRKLVDFLARHSSTEPMEGVNWVKFLNQNNSEATLSDWLILKDIGCFIDNGNGTFAIHKDSLARTFLALRFETNIKGVV